MKFMYIIESHTINISEYKIDHLNIILLNMFYKLWCVSGVFPEVSTELRLGVLCSF